MAKRKKEVGKEAPSKPTVVLKPQTNLNQAKELLKTHNVEVPFDLDNFENLKTNVLFYVALYPNDGWKRVYNKSTVVVSKCWDVMFDESVSEYQRLHQVIDVARYDNLIQALIWHFGNGNSVEELKDWQPKLGLKRQLQAQTLLMNKDFTNQFWVETYYELVGVSDNKEVHNTVLTMKDISLPIQIDTPKELMIEVHDDKVLITTLDHHDLVFPFDELPEFWNNTSNVIGVNGRILLDLMYDRDDCLKADGELNRVFGKTGKPNQQISAFAQALDLTFEVKGREGTATKRWFTKTDKYNEPRWIPMFRHKKFKDGLLIQLMKDISDGKTPKQIADSYNNTITSSKEKNDILSREEDNLFYHSERTTKVSNQYMNPDKNVEVTTSDDILD